jgi:hypothetical protein
MDLPFDAYVLVARFAVVLAFVLGLEPASFFTVRFALSVSLAGLMDREAFDRNAFMASRVCPFCRAVAAIVPTTPPMAAPTGPATTAPNTAPVIAAAGRFGILKSFESFLSRTF